MSESAASNRAEELAQQAIVLTGKGSLEQAAKLLREASSIEAENPSVKAAWDRLKEEESGKGLIALCKKWVETHNDDDGETTLDYIHHHKISPENAEESIKVMLSYEGESDMADQITGELLKNPGARKPLAKRLKEEPTIAFRHIFERGDDSMNGCTDLLLDPSVWDSEAERIAAERDVFQLALAQMMRAGEDNPERAMKSISRILGAESSNIRGLIDADGFDVILSNLDIRLGSVLRGQATLATAKLFELSPDSAQALISQYVVKRVQKPTAESLIQSFSAAASIFPMAPAPAAQLFLSDGFLVNLVKMVSKWKSHRLEQSALELLSAACMDKACREAIRKHCLDWVQKIATASSDPKRVNQASLILVKIKDALPEGEKPQPSDIALDQKAQEQLVSRFKSMILSNDTKGDKQDSVEGLAYSSINPKVKEELANDSTFLKKLVKLMGDPKTMRTSLFGGLTIFANLTTYLPVMSEEQKKISELKAYANSVKLAAPDPLDDDTHVTARCIKVLEAGVIPLFISLGKTLSPTSQTLILQILNSLSKDRKHRSTMAQQGALKLLLEIYDTTTGASPSSSVPVIHEPSDETAARTAAHALSRILISVNPSHVFNTSLPVTSAIRPLSKLLTEDPTSDQRTLLPTFESLLALTNIASVSDTTRESIIRSTWPQLEDLLLSENTMVQRATVELICNLCASGAGVAKFADGSPQAGNRLHILLALTDVDDLATRRAAGGALAMLTEWDAAVDAVLGRESGVRLVVNMCKDEEDEVRHRGIVCLLNIINAPNDHGFKGREALRKTDVKEVVREMILKTKVREIVEAGVEVLKALG